MKRTPSSAVSVLPNMFPYKDFTFEVITYEEYLAIKAINRLFARLKTEKK